MHPLLLFFSLLFLFLSFQIEIYPWLKNQNIWLNKWFFILRNLAVLLLSFIFARIFTSHSLRETGKKNVFAALYILVFVISQSLIAFDWIMSLEYPWFSTLFGGYFFIEAIYMGIATSGIICSLHSRKNNINDNELKKTLKDTATLMFGFSLMWAGLLYAQYLVIWYGNLPEEISFLVNRITHSPYKELSYLVLFLIFWT